MIIFILLGILGGVLGALFIKASRIWARTFRRLPKIKRYPLFEVFLVALITGLVSFWNRYARMPVAELLYEVCIVDSLIDLTRRLTTVVAGQSLQRFLFQWTWFVPNQGEHPPCHWLSWHCLFH